jgi:serine protease AprX
MARLGLLVILLIGLPGLLLSGAAGAGQIGAPGFSAGGNSVLRTADLNGDRVFDDLTAKLDTMEPHERLSVIVRTRGDLTRVGVEAIERSVGGFDLTRRLPIVDGFAATMTKSQVEALPALDSVAQVTENGEVHAFNDSAQASFGVTRAQSDDPDLDGENSGDIGAYTPTDLVAAVIDTGIDATHPQLDDGKVLAFVDCQQPVSETCTPKVPFDDNDHGTHVAGTIAGDGEGDARYKGVAPGAALVGVKVLDADGSGTWEEVIAGIQWVVANKATFGIEAINMSLGGGTCAAGNDPVSAAVEAATAAAIVTLVAAGNDGPDRCTIGTPGAAENVITVGAMADLGVPLDGSDSAFRPGFNLAYFSSRGPTGGLSPRIKPDVAAPGVHITSANANSGGGYQTFNGTSMATPFVAGVALLMLDANPGLTPAQIKTALKDPAIDWARGGEFHLPGSSGADVDYGAGRLDAFAAIKSVDPLLGSAPAMPEHVLLAGTLPGTGSFFDHTIDVTSTSFPLAATLIMTEWNSGNPDFDLRLFDPNGVEVGLAGVSSDRQDESGVLPEQTGTYKVRVNSFSGSGPYILDVSGGSSTAPPSSAATASDATPAGSAASGSAPARSSTSRSAGYTTSCSACTDASGSAASSVAGTDASAASAATAAGLGEVHRPEHEGQDDCAVTCGASSEKVPTRHDQDRIQRKREEGPGDRPKQAAGNASSPRHQGQSDAE